VVKGKTTCSYLGHQSDFQHKYYTFGSVHNCDHHGVFTIIISLSKVVRHYYIVLFLRTFGSVNYALIVTQR